MDHKLKLVITIIGLLVFILLLWLAEIILTHLSRILNVAAIYVILGVSLNLINGFTGQFSLGSRWFYGAWCIRIGFAVHVSFSQSDEFFIQPIIWPLSEIEIPFFFALLIGYCCCNCGVCCRSLVFG